ncbi:MAG TPA: hypothetical protein VI488_14980 [Candidatus Angelobacter sp.]
MLKTILALLLVLRCAGAPAQDKKPAWAFKFEDYAVTKVFQGKPAPPILATEAHRLFRTMIRQGAAKGPNFAGQYAIAEWGCGSSCMSMAVVDAAAGHVYDPPFHSLVMFSTAHPRDYQGPVYRLKSRLLIADGCPDEDETKCGTFYYEWTNNQFKLLRFDPQPQANK